MRVRIGFGIASSRCMCMEVRSWQRWDGQDWMQESGMTGASRRWERREGRGGGEVDCDDALVTW